MKISNSEAKMFTECKRKFFYARVKNLQSKSTALPLYRGTWMHGLLEDYFNSRDWRPRHQEFCSEFEGYFDEEKDVLGDLPKECARLMEVYEYTYDEMDDGINVLGTEVEVEVPLPHGHIYQATLDVVLEDDLGLWVMDHKTHARYPSANFRFTDIQTARYSYACLKHFGELPSGIIWDYIITKPPTKPQLVDKGRRLSKRKINTDLHTFIRAIKEYGLDPKDYRDDIIRLKERGSEFLRRDRVPVTKKVVNQLVKELVYTADEIERGFKPVRTIGRHCDWCQFQSLCVTELYGGDAKMVKRTQYERREERYKSGHDEESDAA